MKREDISDALGLAIVPGRNSNYINSSRGNNVGNFMPNSL